jgi:hypothetical protein
LKCFPVERKRNHVGLACAIVLGELVH